MFLEDEERAPAEDTLHVVRGVVASRPNLFLDVGAGAIDRFVADVAALDSSPAAWASFLDRYGIHRSDPAFWAASDFFNERFSQMDPLSSGILDLSRYVNE